MALDSYQEEIGFYAVEYVRIPSVSHGRMVYVYRASLLETAPFPLPPQSCGTARTLSEARNQAREALPNSAWNAKHHGIETPTQEA